jgi:hypothetical protein
MRRTLLLLTAAVLCYTLACKREDRIETYRVSKDSEAAMPMANAPMMSAPSAGGGDMNSMGAEMGMSAAGNSNEVEWKVPAGWKVQPPSAMRLGSFRVPGPNGQSADVSVVPLSGMAGGDLANINRWRDQISLPPISEGDLAQHSQTIKPGGRKMLLIDFVSSAPLIEDRYKKRLIAAIYTQGERTWFFKMTGEDATVAQAKPAFLTFLKTLRFRGE